LYPIQNDVRNRLDLSGLWDFKIDPDEVGEQNGWFNGLDVAARKNYVPACISGTSPISPPCRAPGAWADESEGRVYPHAHAQNGGAYLTGILGSPDPKAMSKIYRYIGPHEIQRVFDQSEELDRRDVNPQLSGRGNQFAALSIFA
jgi:hypothetical protein